MLKISLDKLQYNDKRIPDKKRDFPRHFATRHDIRTVLLMDYVRHQSTIRGFVPFQTRIFKPIFWDEDSAKERGCGNIVEWWREADGGPGVNTAAEITDNLRKGSCKICHIFSFCTYGISALSQYGLHNLGQELS
jgi:hypothetical protein